MVHETLYCSIELSNPMNKPLLSICIPTYNRAQLLKSALHNLVPQIIELGDTVELIVSDNCSQDDTVDAVAKYMENDAPIRYHRNERNLGAVRNILLLCNELARGEYCWILGDDDRVRQGGVARIVEILREHPEIDYVYVNYSTYIAVPEPGKFANPADFGPWGCIGIMNLNDRYVSRWETLTEEDCNCLTATYCSVFRRTLWLSASKDLLVGDPFTSVESTYPHTVILARVMIGRSAWATGYPWVLNSVGAHEWTDYVTTVWLQRFPELLDLLIENGVDRKLLDRHRRRMFRYCIGPLSRQIAGFLPKGLTGFSFLAFVAKNYRYPEMWRILPGAFASVSLRRVVRYKPFIAPFVLSAKFARRARNIFRHD